MQWKIEPQESKCRECMRSQLLECIYRMNERSLSMHLCRSSSFTVRAAARIVRPNTAPNGMNRDSVVTVDDSA